MEDNMVEKYQEHYKQVLTGTLTDTFMKTIAFQANIKLANEIIADQEKTITELKNDAEKLKKEFEDSVSKLKNELETFRNGKVVTENNKISSLENNIKIQSENISRLNSEIVRLNSELANANRLRVEYDALKGQVSNVDVFRKELIKERESHEQTKTQYEQKIRELTDEIDLLKAPPKRKKVNKAANILELVAVSDNNEEVVDETVKDGGTF